jgi:hypothetical protein
MLPINRNGKHNDSRASYTKHPDCSGRAKQLEDQNTQGRVALSWIDEDNAKQASRYKPRR